MKPAPFKYMRPDTLDEALSVLAKHGDDVRVIAGGQSLGAMLNMRIVSPAILLDINRLSALETIESQKTGALVRQRDALESPLLRKSVPLLVQALPHVGHYQTRNRGTLGGSVAHADPSAEISLVLATLGGEVELRSQRRRRKLVAADFFRSGLVTAREPDELLMALWWPVASPSTRSAFLEFAVREGDFAIAAVACVFDEASGRLRLGFGGCGETPQVVQRELPSDLDAKTVNDVVEEMTNSLKYRSDLLASAAYRRQLARVMARRAIAQSLNWEPVYV